jgi:tetratricopeptide (TPR) repeat protein
MTDTPSDGPSSGLTRSEADLDLFLEQAFKSNVPYEERGTEGLPVAVGGHPVLSLVGHGGMGIVFRGHDPELGRDVAIKVLKPRYASDPAIVARFTAEARISAQLQHPGIVPIHSIGVDERGEPYFTMKLVEGRSLAALLADRVGPEDERQRLLDVFLKACHAAAFAHSRGIVHRDLKPSNVMVGDFGEVHLVDWGLAKVLRATEAGDSRVALDDSDDDLAVRMLRLGTPIASSMVGEVLGTLAYMAPEQARGLGDIDQRADVFALGSILCEILTGSPTYVATSRAEARELAAHAELGPAMQRLRSDTVDAGLAALALHCLDADPGARPRDAGVLARALEAWFAAVDARARAAELAAAEARTRAEHAALRAAAERRARRSTTAFAILAVTAVLGAAVIYAVVSSERRERATNAEAAIGAALQEVAALRVEAFADPAEASEIWVRAEAALARAVTAAEASGAVPARREQLLALERELRSERDQADLLAQRNAADSRVVAALEKAREEFSLHLATRRLRIDTQAALAAYGVDVETRSVDEAATLVAASPVSRKLLDALDFCGLLGYGASEQGRRLFQRLLNISQAADADPARTELREAIVARDVNSLRRIAESDATELLSASALGDLGTALAIAGDAAASRTLLLRAHTLYPNDFWLLYALVHNKSGPESVEFGRACVALRPESATAWCALGATLGESGRMAEARDAFQRVVALDPTSQRGYVNLALALLNGGDPRAAVAAALRAIDLGAKDEPTFYLVLNATLRLGDVELGLQTFEELLARFPAVIMVHGSLAYWREMSGDLLGAVQAFEVALALDHDPVHAAAHWVGISRPLRNLGRFREAYEAVRRAHEQGSSRPNWSATSPEMVAEYEALARVEDRLTVALVEGAGAASTDELEAFAQMCGVKGLHAAEAHFYATALATNMARSADQFARLQRNGARAALRTGFQVLQALVL